VGLTAVHDFDGPTCLEALRSMRERGSLGIRVVKHLRETNPERAFNLGLSTGAGDAWIRIGNLKLFADGALGPRTAAMLEPYQDQPTNTGMLLLSQDEMVTIGQRAAQAGVALAIHAIGDRANREALDALARVRIFESEHGLPRLRHRIEHAQLVHAADLPRFQSLDVVASMQPIHATSDMQMADVGWGDRVQTAYAWQGLLRSHAVLAFGSDAPVEDPNPFWGLHAAVTRRRRDGSPSAEGWVGSQRLTVRQALQAYTLGPSFAAGLEAMQGCLSPGAFADALVMERDPFDCPPEELLELRVLGTLVAGVWRFRVF
jgi:predicted amidohydrolase YtcJ